MLRKHRLSLRLQRFIGICLLAVPFFTLSTVAFARRQAQITQPQQPASGPGGAQANFKVRESTYGSGATQYWIFEPEPLQGSAPVIVLLHGWSALVPGPYQSWIDHLVRRGNIVIYPKYQESLKELPPNMTPNALAAIRDALSKLGNRADRNRFAVVGHSVGGIITYNVAGEGGSNGIPTVKAFMSAHAADTDVNPLLRGRVKVIRDMAKISQIPRTTLA